MRRRHTLRSSRVPIPTMQAPCVRTFSVENATTLTGTESHGLGATRTVTDGWVMHDAWHISWKSFDTSTLSPSLPTLTSDKFLMTWMPGQTVAAGEGDMQTKDPKPDPTIVGAMCLGMVGVPVITVA